MARKTDWLVFGGIVAGGIALVWWLRDQNTPSDGASVVGAQPYPVYSGGVGNGGGSFATIPAIVPTFDFSNQPPVQVPEIYIGPTFIGGAGDLLSQLNPQNTGEQACGCGTSVNAASALVTATPSPYLGPLPQSAELPQEVFPPLPAAPQRVFNSAYGTYQRVDRYRGGGPLWGN